MKCEHCNGAMIYQPGNSIEPAIYVCMACGREPKGKEEKIMEEKEKRECIQCGNEFEPKIKKSRFCSKPCGDKWYKGNRIQGHRKRKKIIQKSVLPSPIPKINDAILLDQQILKAIKKSVANQIIRIIEEAFA
jgi:DNA-directed RNA polymerase subunit RPC12/RpoP